MTTFLDEARRTLDSCCYDDEDDENDCRYLVWICGAMFQEEEGAKMQTLLDRWQSRIVALLTQTDERDWILWRLLLQNVNVTTVTLCNAARELVLTGSDKRVTDVLVFKECEHGHVSVVDAFKRGSFFDNFTGNE